MRDEGLIREKIAELDSTPGWYQDIDLGNGIHTKSRVFWGEDADHPKSRFTEVERAIPRDLTGMSVLDVGCNAGYFSFEAKRRGAQYVCGVDLKQGYIEQAKFCNDVLNAGVDFRILSVYDLSTLGMQFDLVIFVGLLYHCKYLMTAIEQVSSVAKRRLIVESAIIPKKPPKSGLIAYLKPAISKQKTDTPLVRFISHSKYNGPHSSDEESRLPGYWHPNMAALKNMFYEQGFSHVEELFTKGGRGGIVADR